MNGSKKNLLRISIFFLLLSTFFSIALGVLRYYVVDIDYIPIYDLKAKIYLQLSSVFSPMILFILFILAVVLRLISRCEFKKWGDILLVLLYVLVGIFVPRSYQPGDPIPSVKYGSSSPIIEYSSPLVSFLKENISTLFYILFIFSIILSVKYLIDSFTDETLPETQ